LLLVDSVLGIAMTTPGLWILCLLVTAAFALEQSYSDYAAQLRAHLLPNMDTAVPPKSVRTVDYSKAGTEVRMSIRFFKVQSVDASTGQMRLKVWVRMTWQDLRLSWTPEDFGNVTEVTFRAVDATDVEGTEIWVPDIQMYNSNEGTFSTLDGANPIAYSDGTIFWSRPGIVDSMCKFTGLVAFPFDKLQCAMEWGAWSWSDGFQGINLTGPGYVFLTNEDTAGASYQEYSIKSVEVSLTQTFYDTTPNQPWTIVKYNVELNRATFYYGTLVLLPTIIITYLSFGVFFMSHEVGERLSFGITLLLVVEVARTSVAAFVPICGELLWIDLFMLVNSFFCCMSLLETMTVLFFAFHTDEHLLPNWLAWLAPWLFCVSSKGGPRVVESQAGTIYRRFSKGILTSQAIPKMSVGTIEAQMKEGKLSETDTAKLIFFENLFYMLDSDSNGLILIEDAAVMLSFVNLSMSREELEKILTDHFNDPEHRLDCSDFVEICVEVMWTMPFQEIKMGAENYNSCYMRFTKLCANYWLTWSKTVDRWCRFWLPVTFTVSLGILFNLELTDDYAGAAGSSEMFQGFGPSYMTVAGVFRSLVVPIFAVICIIAWLYMRKRAEKTPQNESQSRKSKAVVPEAELKPIVPRWSVHAKMTAEDVDE